MLLGSGEARLNEAKSNGVGVHRWLNEEEREIVLFSFSFFGLSLVVIKDYFHSCNHQCIFVLYSSISLACFHFKN